MFVRFRATKSTLQVSLLVGRRVNGRVRHEQVAALGSIALPLTVPGREAFWIKLHAGLGRLGNRVSADIAAAIMERVHARIPLPTMEERRAQAIDVAGDDQQFWSRTRDSFTEFAAASAKLAAAWTAQAAADRAQADDAAAKAAAAQHRAERLHRGEDVPRGGEIAVDERAAALRRLRGLCGE